MFEALANAASFGLPGLDPFSRAGAAVQFFIMDVAAIMAYGVMPTPGVVVVGRLVHAGGIPGPDVVRTRVQE